MSVVSALFEPFTINKLEVPNRIVMAPMTRSFSPGGVPTEDVAAYYRRRAEGGTGLIITEGTTIDHGSASGDPHIPNFHTPEALDGWSRVVDEVHEGGGLIMPQIWHMGAMRPSGTGPSPETETVSPSGLKYPGKETGIALSKQEVNDIVDAYVSAAVSAKELGFDGVQFHGAHGYLIDLFFWSGTNLRDDEFGGELAERTRFAEDIISKTRAEVGDDFPLILRFSQWKQQDFEHKMATDPDQLAAFLAPLTAAGVDSFDCSTRRFWEHEFEGSDLNLAGWVKKLSGVPTITVGSVGLNSDFINAFAGEGSQAAPIDDLVKRVGDGEFDLVGVGRALLANADWANRIRNGDIDGLKDFTKEDLSSLT